ncbi:hypothetical protein [Tateyamaria sp. syn59]|nr:hypothetical protein [Tateyamaria sp. syn59]
MIVLWNMGLALHIRQKPKIKVIPTGEKAHMGVGGDARLQRRPPSG